VLIFAEGGKPENPEKNPRGMREISIVWKKILNIMLQRDVNLVLLNKPVSHIQTTLKLQIESYRFSGTIFCFKFQVLLIHTQITDNTN